MRVASGMGLEGQVVPMMAAATLSIGVAWVSWRYVERPMLRFKHRWATSGREASRDDATSALERLPIGLER